MVLGEQVVIANSKGSIAFYASGWTMTEMKLLFFWMKLCPHKSWEVTFVDPIYETMTGIEHIVNAILGTTFPKLLGREIDVVTKFQLPHQFAACPPPSAIIGIHPQFGKHGASILSYLYHEETYRNIFLSEQRSKRAFHVISRFSGGGKFGRKVYRWSQQIRGVLKRNPEQVEMMAMLPKTPTTFVDQDGQPVRSFYHLLANATYHVNPELKAGRDYDPALKGQKIPAFAPGQLPVKIMQE